MVREQGSRTLGVQMRLLGDDLKTVPTEAAKIAWAPSLDWQNKTRTLNFQ